MSMTTSSSNTSHRLTRKVAIVTGVSSGLGRVIALAFANQGTRLVVCADLQPNAATEDVTPTCELIHQQYGKERALFRKTDIDISGDIEACVADAMEYGGGKLNV